MTLAIRLAVDIVLTMPTPGKIQKLRPEGLSPTDPQPLPQVVPVGLVGKHPNSFLTVGDGSLVLLQGPLVLPVFFCPVLPGFDTLWGHPLDHGVDRRYWLQVRQDLRVVLQPVFPECNVTHK